MSRKFRAGKVRRMRRLLRKGRGIETVSAVDGTVARLMEVLGLNAKKQPTCGATIGGVPIGVAGFLGASRATRQTVV
jgi:hypothetical protein